MNEKKLINVKAEWIHSIPSNWKLKKVKEVYNFVSVKVSDKDYPALSVSSKYGITPQMENVAKTLNGDLRKRVEKGDFVINSRADRPGACGISEYNGSVSMICHVLKPKNKDMFYPPYMHYLYRNTMFSQEFYRWGRGIVADLWSTRKDEFGNLQLPIPTLNEQKKIGDFLSEKEKHLNQLIDLKEKQLNLLEEKRQSIITEGIIKGLNPNVKMKDSGEEWIGEIPEHWNIKSLSYVCKITRLAGYEYTSYWDPKEDGEIIALRGQNIGINKINVIGNEERIRESLSQRLIRSRLFKGDVVFPCVGSIGKAACIYEDNKYHINQNIAKLTPKESLDSEFLTYFLNSAVTLFQINWYNTSEMQPSVLVGNLRKFKIVVPDIQEQKEIVKSISVHLSDLMKLTETVSIQIHKLKEYRQSLIYEAVTGKIDIRELVTEK